MPAVVRPINRQSESNSISSSILSCQSTGSPQLNSVIGAISRVIRKVKVLQPTTLLPMLNPEGSTPKLCVRVFTWGQREKFLRAVGTSRLSEDVGFITAILLGFCDEDGNAFFTPTGQPALPYPTPSSDQSSSDQSSSEGSIPFSPEDIDWVKELDTILSQEIFEQVMIINGFYKGDNEAAKNSGETSTLAK